MYKPGTIVRYKAEFCEPSERHLLHVVLENLLSPATGEATRVLIETLNGNTYFNLTETIEDYMIEAVDQKGDQT